MLLKVRRKKVTSTLVTSNNLEQHETQTRLDVIDLERVNKSELTASDWGFLTCCLLPLHRACFLAPPLITIYNSTQFSFLPREGSVISAVCYITQSHRWCDERRARGCLPQQHGQRVSCPITQKTVYLAISE